jgi:hypothetical protein
VSVSDKNTRSVFVNFGNIGKTAPAPWNNWLGFKGNNAVITNLKDETNTATTFGVTMVNSWGGLTDLGHITGNNSGVYPDSVLQSGLVDFNASRTINITGLNNAMKYNIVLVGSMNEGINATVEYSSGTTKDTLNAKYNTHQTANLNGLVPIAGTITVTTLKLPGITPSYLNALVIEEYDPAITLLNPINLYAEPVDRTSADLSWSDRTVGEDASQGYVLERARDSLFTQSVVSIALPGNTTTYRNTGLVPNTRYWYRVRAKDSGGQLSEYSNRVKTITPASIVYMNFNYTLPDAEYPWNNTFTAPTFEATFDNLINQSGIVSGLSMTLTRIFNGEFTAGVKTGNNSGIVSDLALASNYWLDNTQLSQFRVSGMNHSRKYRIGFFGSSSSAGWFKGNYTATYTINGQTVYLNSWMNSSKIVYINDVVPDENGEVYLDFSTTAAAAYGFNGGVLIEDYTDPAATTVVNLANFSSLASGVRPGNIDENVTLAQQASAAANGKMYPNPFIDFINMDFSNSSADNNISVDVYDLSGRLSFHKNYGKLPGGNNTLRLSASDAGMNIGTGVYIITLNVNGKAIQANKVIRTKN